MIGTLTLTIQKDIRFKDDDDWQEKVDATVEALEAHGWSVDVASEDFDGDEEE